ncbi:MAG TPA: hypothetical protein VE863_21350 [Pyrinomonadaceae bacterium]|nr:hypothetical protein [Pyrinomonadaceae bacterium]
MRIAIRFLLSLICAGVILLAGACQSGDQNSNTTATSSATPPGDQPANAANNSSPQPANSNQPSRH